MLLEKGFKLNAKGKGRNMPERWSRPWDWLSVESFKLQVERLQNFSEVAVARRCNYREKKIGKRRRSKFAIGVGGVGLGVAERCG